MLHGLFLTMSHSLTGCAREKCNTSSLAGFGAKAAKLDVIGKFFAELFFKKATRRRRVSILGKKAALGGVAEVAVGLLGDFSAS